MTTTFPRTPTRAAMAALAAAMLLASLGISIVSVALPSLSRVFSASVSSVQWVVLAYLISATVAIVLAGRLGDRFGHRRVLLVGLALFAVASAVCACATQLGMLAAARAAQGIGGAILMALPMSILREMIGEKQTGSAMGILATMSALGTALGPSLGGVLIASFGWRSAFVLLAASGVLVFGVAMWAIPKTPKKPSQSEPRMDWLGASLLAITLTAYALVTAGKSADLDWGARWLVPVLLLALVCFVIVQARSASPLVPVSILRDRVIGASLAMNLLVTTVMMSTLVVGPFFLFFGLGLNEAMVGLVMAVGPVTAAVVGVPAGRLTDRYGAQRVVVGGLIQIGFGLVCLAILPRWLGVSGYVAALILLTPGFQLFLTANNTAVMLTGQHEQRGMLSGLLGLSRNLGFMTGASVMATLFATALGREAITSASARAVTDAFTTTFVVAAGLSVVAFVLAVFGRPLARASGDSEQRGLI